MARKLTFLPALLLIAAVAVSGCTTNRALSGFLPSVASGKTYPTSLRARDCLMRAMYFESIRSSRDGLLAVGTVVMNRVESPKFPNSVCGVVSQPRQFAPGVMTRTVKGDKKDLADLADQILAGKRHPGVRKAKFFHTAGLRFPYNNMHYVLKAGGNEFYEKRSRRKRRKS